MFLMFSTYVMHAASLRRRFVFTLAVQARDPSVHAAILAHLNQKYGSGSGSEPPNAEANQQVSRADNYTAGQNLTTMVL